MTTQHVKALFESEFGPILDKFRQYELTLQQAQTLDDGFVWKPGCYVWWSPSDKVVKVGVSLINARKRALEHIRADYGDGEKNGLFEALVEQKGSRLLLFVLKDEEEKHWAAAAEIYLEQVLNPAIKSGRLG